MKPGGWQKKRCFLHWRLKLKKRRTNGSPGSKKATPTQSAADAFSNFLTELNSPEHLESVDFTQGLDQSDIR